MNLFLYFRMENDSFMDEERINNLNVMHVLSKHLKAFQSISQIHFIFWLTYFFKPQVKQARLLI